MISISVVMPVYNIEISMLQEAVNSILSQTFQDFEFIIIDDASADNVYRYLKQIKDERIKLIRNSEHLGTTKSLNIGLKEAKGKYIARMDGDDIAFPTRFEKQFNYMERHPDVIICGANIENFGDRSGKCIRKITDMENYRIRTVFFNPGPFHPTAFFNREQFQRYQITYDESLVCSQDYGLWVTTSRIGRLYILKDVLLRYRRHSHQVSSEQKEKQFVCAKMIQRRLLLELLGNVTDEELDLHFRYSSGYFKDATINDEILNWYRRLVAANDRVGVYDKKEFRFIVFNGVVKRIIYQSFEPDMGVTDKIGMFFRYLPFPIALRSTAGISVKSVKEWIKRL